MYLTRIELDLKRQETMRALASPNRFHGAIEQAASDERTRKLWRLDSLREKQYLMILSEKEEDWKKVAEQFGAKGVRIETKNYDTLLNRVTSGSKWHFLLRANPTISQKTKDGNNTRGKVMAHTTEEFQKKWLLKKAEKNGFSLTDETFCVTEKKWYHFYKGSGKNNYYVRLLAVTYEGVLTVTDVSLFQNALLKGIGREKAYGMGMLTIVSGS